MTKTGTAWTIVDSQGRQIGGFYATKKIAQRYLGDRKGDRVVRATGRYAWGAGRVSNPASVIPHTWKQAKVRRLKDGRVQVMISGRARNPKPLRVIKVTPPYDWGAGKGGKSWIIVDSEGKQVSGFYKTKKMAESFKRRK